MTIVEWQMEDVALLLLLYKIDRMHSFVIHHSTFVIKHRLLGIAET